MIKNFTYEAPEMEVWSGCAVMDGILMTSGVSSEGYEDDGVDYGFFDRM